MKPFLATLILASSLSIAPAIASDLKIELGKAPMTAKFISEEWSIWGGSPVTLLCAADTTDENGVRHSFNVQIPLEITIEQ